MGERLAAGERVPPECRGAVIREFGFEIDIHGAGDMAREIRPMAGRFGERPADIEYPGARPVGGSRLCGEHRLQLAGADEEAWLRCVDAFAHSAIVGDGAWRVPGAIDSKLHSHAM